MVELPPITLRLRGRKVVGRVAFSLLLLASIALGGLAGLLFVYSSDLPQIRALEDFQPDVVTELYADDGQVVGNFALQRRVLLTYEQFPQVLKDAILTTEDQHFEEHWGVDFTRVAGAAYKDLVAHHVVEGASTITMQLAGTLFLDRSDRRMGRKIQEALLALQIERYYSKQQIFTMYANQIYLSHGTYGFEAASEYYFGKPVGKLNVQEAALLAGLIRGPSYSPILHPQRALARRNLVLELMAHNGKITEAQAKQAVAQPMGLHPQAPRNTLAPYFVEEIRKYLETTYGTEMVHQRGLRVYTTLNVAMQQAANHAVRDGLHAYDRRHGWRGMLDNILANKSDTLESYEDDDWRWPINKGDYVQALVTAVDQKAATIKIGSLRALLTQPDFAWTGRKSPADLFKPGDLVEVSIKESNGTVAHVQLEQNVGPQAAIVALDNPTGEIKAMVGGYSFDESKFNRATQAQRQVGSSFKIYVYSAAVEQGFTPFDTILDAPFTTISGGQAYSPHNYDEKFEGVITLRRALDGSRNIPAVKLAEKVGMNSVIDMARRFGITSPLPPYLPITLGAADLNLLEHTSAFTVFPNDGIRIDPHMIRRVTTYDGALLEQAHPLVHDVVEPDVARTMTAMLQDVVERGTGTPARALNRPAAGKTGTTNDFTDAWFIGFTPEITAGVWVGYDDKAVSLGKPETGAIAALPIWLEFMQGALDGKPVQQFPNVMSLDKVALTKNVKVDTPDTAPTEAGEAPTGAPSARPDIAPTLPDSAPLGEAPAKAIPPPQNPPAAASPRS
jgi:penicillin-binding protein 1A